MSKLTKMVDDRILDLRQKEDENIVQEYADSIKNAEERAIRGEIGYDAWFLKNPEDDNRSFEETPLMHSLKGKIQGDCLEDVTPDDIEQAWYTLANYMSFLKKAKRLGKTYSYLKWDDNLENEIMEKGKEGILSSLETNTPLYEEYATKLSRKPYPSSYSIRDCRTDLIIKKEIVKNYIGEAASNVVRKMNKSIKKLQLLEFEISHKENMERYNWLMKFMEEKAEEGRYDLPWKYLNEIKIDDDNVTIPDIKKVPWREIAGYASHFKEAEEMIKNFPFLREDYNKRKCKIETKGRLNVFYNMVTDIKNTKNIPMALLLKEILKLIEKGEI
ncbi:MAG: hypothetical protein ISS23_02495 [Nanoarchaeota archaeon]|nr:hypothetical protein [Nanoarchaeota archaeon]